jgi:uncharacterized protein with FMN-binding domain
MKRAPIVIAGTVVGLIGVLKFHTAPISLSGSSVPAASASASPAAASSSSQAATGGTQAGSASPQPSAGAQSSATRTATGPSVYYDYGTLSVRVTASGKRIVKVSIASLDDGSNPRSQEIDQQSIPLLEQEVMQAQSSHIQGISGASYTSAGFYQSLQGALKTLGIA